MICPVCGKEVNEGELFCPECGTKLSTVTETGKVAEEKVEQAVVNDEKVEQPEQKTEQQPLNDNAEIEETTPSKLDKKTAKKQKKLEAKTKRNRKKAWIIVGIIAAVVVIAAVLCVIFFGPISNFFVKNFASPATYYQYVEAKTLKNFADNMSTRYENNIEKGEDFFNAGGYEGKFDLGMETRFLELLEFTEMDFTTLKNISTDFKFNKNFTEDISQIDFNGTLNINKKEIFKYDFGQKKTNKGELIYGYVNEISPKYFGINIDNTILPKTDSKDVLESLPDSATVKSLAIKYGLIIFGSVKNGTLERDVVFNILDLEKEGDKVTITLTKEEQDALIRKLAEEIKKDEQIKKIVLDILKAYDSEKYGEYTLDNITELFDSGYENFMKKYEESKDEYLKETFTMSLYVDDNGISFAREITYGNFRFKTGMITQNKEYEVLFTADDSHSAYFSLSGQGTIPSKDTYSGEVVLRISSEKILTVKYDNFNLTDLLRLKSKGTISIIPSSKVINDFIESLDLGEFYRGFMTGALSGINFSIDYDLKQKDNTVKLTLNKGSDVYLTLLLRVKTTEQKPIENITDFMPYEEWKKLFGENFDNINKKMTEAGMPMPVVIILGFLIADYMS